jgi:hypothetical protein
MHIHAALRVSSRLKRPRRRMRRGNPGLVMRASVAGAAMTLRAGLSRTPADQHIYYGLYYRYWLLCDLSVLASSRLRVRLNGSAAESQGVVYCLFRRRLDGQASSDQGEAYPFSFTSTALALGLCADAPDVHSSPVHLLDQRFRQRIRSISASRRVDLGDGIEKCSTIVLIGQARLGPM